MGATVGRQRGRRPPDRLGRRWAHCVWQRITVSQDAVDAYLVDGTLPNRILSASEHAVRPVSRNPHKKVKQFPRTRLSRPPLPTYAGPAMTRLYARAIAGAPFSWLCRPAGWRRASAAPRFLSKIPRPPRPPIPPPIRWLPDRRHHRSVADRPHRDARAADRRRRSLCRGCREGRKLRKVVAANQRAADEAAWWSAVRPLHL